MSTVTPAYEQLAATWTRLHNLEHLQSIAGWDHAANMPPKGNEARAAALAEMAALLHRMRTDPAVGTELQRAEQEPLDELQRANLREMQRQWQASTALPEALVQQQQIAASRCEHAWRRQRPANDWAGFVENLKPVLALARQEAALLAEKTGVRKYDALMQRFEPGMSCTRLDGLFGDVRQWLPGLIQQVLARQAQQPVRQPVGPFPQDKQRALCEQVVRLLGFDFEAGRLDVSTHPFCGGVPEDVRLTTRFRDDEFLTSLMGTIHETGHGRYEQNLPRALLGQPVAQARSMALHESQSLSFEMQLGSHPGFVARLAPLVTAAFGDQPAFAPQNLHRLITRVKPGFIRHPALRDRTPADRRRDRARRRAGAVGCQDDGAAGRGHTRQLHGRAPAGRALALGPVRLLPLLFARGDVCRAVVCHHAPRHARPGRSHRRGRPGPGLRLAESEHLEPGQPLDHPRAGATGQW